MAGMSRGDRSSFAVFERIGRKAGVCSGSLDIRVSWVEPCPDLVGCAPLTKVHEP